MLSGPFVHAQDSTKLFTLSAGPHVVFPVSKSKEIQTFSEDQTFSTNQWGIGPSVGLSYGKKIPGVNIYPYFQASYLYFRKRDFRFLHKPVGLLFGTIKNTLIPVKLGGSYNWKMSKNMVIIFSAYGGTVHQSQLLQAEGSIYRFKKFKPHYGGSLNILMRNHPMFKKVKFPGDPLLPLIGIAIDLFGTQPLVSAALMFPITRW